MVHLHDCLQCFGYLRKDTALGFWNMYWHGTAKRLIRIDKKIVENPTVLQHVYKVQESKYIYIYIYIEKHATM